MLRLIALALICTGCSGITAHSIDLVEDETEIETISSGIEITDGCTTVSNIQIPASTLGAINTDAPMPGSFSRPMFPRLIKQGPWSSTVFVRDANNLTLPALVSTGNTPGWLDVPFTVGETMTGIRFYVCGNSSTAFFIGIFATRTETSPGDHIESVVGGGDLHPPNVWTAVSLTTPPITFQQGSMLYVRMTSTNPGGTPVSMAVSAVIPYFD